jgi:hypothetical protein
MHSNRECLHGSMNQVVHRKSNMTMQGIGLNDTHKSWVKHARESRGLCARGKYILVVEIGVPLAMERPMVFEGTLISHIDAQDFFVLGHDHTAERMIDNLRAPPCSWVNR